MIKHYPEIADSIAKMAAPLPSDRRLPGSAVLARKFDVNQRTIMKALHLLAEKNLVVIRGTSGVFPVHKNISVRKQSGIIAIVGVASHTELAGFVREKLAASGYRPVFLDFDPEVFEENPAFVLNFSVDGFLFRFSRNFNLKIEKHLSEIHVPFVLLNLPSGVKLTDSSANDLRTGWELILNHLREKGYRRIVFLEEKAALGYERYEEYIRKIFREVLGDDLSDGKCFFLEQGKDPAKVLGTVNALLTLPEGPDAIVTGSGWLATLLLRKFPQPRSFVIGASWDGNDPPPPELFCAFHDTHDRVGWALDRLLLRISGDNQPSEHHVSPVRIQIPGTWQKLNLQRNLTFHKINKAGKTTAKDGSAQKT